MHFCHRMASHVKDPVQPICTSVFFIFYFLLIFIIHSILYCTFYLIAHLTLFILLFVPFFILTYIYIYILLCYVSLFLLLMFFYFIFYLIIIILFFCTFHWADLSCPTFHYGLYPVWLCMWQIIKNLEMCNNLQAFALEKKTKYWWRTSLFYCVIWR